MKKKIEKPSPEAKALSLFLMAFKSTSPLYKEKARHMNKLWDMVALNKVTKDQYNEEVQKMLTAFGGYDQVVERTVRYYIRETGEWKSNGNDKYSLDAKKIAERIPKK